jgi:predicted dehydrogenase
MIRAALIFLQSGEKHMRRIKLGLLGAGLAWERLHRPALARLADKYEVVAVCDRNIAKARSQATALGLPQDRAFYEAERLLAETDLDAVDLMVPIGENYELAKTVLKKGKHLVAEKPFAATPDHAKELARLARRHGLVTLVAENERYDSENKIIKDLIATRRVGNVAYFVDNHVAEIPQDMLGDTFAAKEWRQHPDYPGGLFLDAAVHHMARQRFLFGDVGKIFATGRHSDVEYCPYSCVNALLTFENDVVGHYAYFNIAQETQAPLVGLRVFGTQGEIYLEDKGCGFVNLSLKDGSREAIPYTPGEGYYNELLNFYNALTAGEEIVSSPEKELGDIHVIFDILKSIANDSALQASNNYPKAAAAAASARRRLKKAV